jgi:hypothetical protein
MVLSNGMKIAIAAGAGVAIGVGGTFGVQALCAEYGPEVKSHPSGSKKKTTKRPVVKPVKKVEKRFAKKAVQQVVKKVKPISVDATKIATIEEIIRVSEMAMNIINPKELKKAFPAIQLLKDMLKSAPEEVMKWTKDKEFTKMEAEIWSPKMRAAKTKLQAGIVDESVMDAFGPEFKKIARAELEKEPEEKAVA